ncbi:hypothetical protein BU14_0424s0014 [Porphyra umbilicalis]|uniref:Uncharacterized protein n=1 Tax=Porphyra umbilicalis TaxID=2786 RepID=A0A1X6NVC2_PORUM|nr:hypothetical protein BU14_0424s0014 [Porphyra umbilicalis]|eukprot:OSX72558.1 hypothetical protein BU14_0424s0014 [Porphyra umbilicalis]
MGRAVRPPWRGRVVGGAKLPRRAAPPSRRGRLADPATAAAGGKGRSAASRVGRRDARAGVWRRPRLIVAAQGATAAGPSGGEGRTRRRQALAAVVGNVATGRRRHVGGGGGAARAAYKRLPRLLVAGEEVGAETRRQGTHVVVGLLLIARRQIVIFPVIDSGDALHLGAR